MSLIKRAACEAIALRIAGAVSELSSTAKASHADEEVKAAYPSLRVMPGRMTFVPYQEDEIDYTVAGAQPGDDPIYPNDPETGEIASVVLATVGDFEGTVELKLYCDSQKKRETIEGKIMALLLGREGAPGNLVVQTAALTLDANVTLYTATVSCFLDDEDWNEEMVFDKKRMSTLTLQCSFPALITRTIYRMDDVRLAISEDLEATAPDYTVGILSDGTLEPVAP